METKKTKSDFLDKLVAMVLAPYGIFAFFKSGGWANFMGATRKGWQGIQSTLSDLEVAYTKKAGRWWQVVSGIAGAAFLLVMALMLAFWNKQADGLGLYQIVLLLSALFSALFIANIPWLQGAVPEYARDGEGRLIPDLETKGYRLSDSKRHRFGRISAIGLSVVFFVAFGMIFLGFMALSVLQRSTALVVVSLPFFGVAAGTAIFYEKLIKFMVFQTQYYASLVIEEGMDFTSVVLPDKVMADFFQHLEDLKKKGELAKPTNSNVSDAIIVPVLLAVFVHLFWVKDHPGFVMWADLCILGMTLVPIIGLKTGQKETVEKQKNLWFSGFVKFAMALTVLAKLIEANGRSVISYLSGVIIISSEPWKVIVSIVVLVGLAILFFFAASVATKDGAKRASYVMWVLSTLCFVIGLINFYAFVSRPSKEAVAESNKGTASAVASASVTATASVSAPIPPPAKDEATKLVDARIEELKKVNETIKGTIDDGHRLVALLDQTKAGRGESTVALSGKTVVVTSAAPVAEKKVVAKTSSAPTSEAPQATGNKVAVNTARMSPTAQDAYAKLKAMGY